MLPQAVKKFIITAVCLSAALASNGPAKDKKHVQAAQDALVYQGAIMRFPNGTASSFPEGRFASSYRHSLSVGSFSGNSKPREPSLKSAHDLNLAWFLARIGPRPGLQIRSCYAVRDLVTTLFVGGSNSGEPGDLLFRPLQPKARRKVPLFFGRSALVFKHPGLAH